MEDFKKIIKMKTGGSVSKAIEAYEKRERKTEVSDDIAQDKTLVKKGVKQHESNLHKGEPKTELTFKKGGRAKKETGTVKKYKCGGKIQKKADGGLLSGLGAISSSPAPSAPIGQGAISDLEKRRQMEKMARAKKYLGPAQQGELISQDPTAAGLPASPAAPIMRKKGGKACK